MRTLTVALGDRSYPIHIGAGLLAKPELIMARLPQKRVAIVTDSTVAPLYLARLRGLLEGNGVRVLEIVLPDGEEFKNWQTLNGVLDALMQNRCERKTAILALGGGVIGDVAGFAAAVYQRGVPYIQIPTTLLAQVDSAVGGKTAINHPLGKNMVGAFYQPLAVITDTDTLATLPDRQLSAGIAEVVKYGLIRDAAFLEWLEQNIDRLLGREAEALEYAVERSCRIKAEIVALDERESGLRAVLNFGHTFGHAIEAGAGFGTWLHGEAVAAGMVLASALSRRMGFISAPDFARVVRLLERARLPVAAPEFGSERFRALMEHDKKVEAGALRFVLLQRIGEALVTDAVPAVLLDEVLGQQPAHV